MSLEVGPSSSGVRAVSCHELNSELAQLRKADFLHHQIAGEAAGGLDNDRADAIAGSSSALA